MLNRTMLASVTWLLAACSPDAQPAAEALPSFARDIAPVLEARCAQRGGCHGEAPTPAVDLDLRRAASYRELVAVPAETGRLALLRVEPGHPATSLLLHKLTGRSGKTMPLDPQTGQPLTPSPISLEWIERSLVPWIAAGAPAN